MTHIIHNLFDATGYVNITYLAKAVGWREREESRDPPEEHSL